MESSTLEQKVRILLYLSTLCPSKTQFLFEKIDWSRESQALIKDLLKKKSAHKRIMVLGDSSEIPNWIQWPASLSFPQWRDFVNQSSRLSLDAVLLCFVLGFDRVQAAQLLEITEGGVGIALAEGLVSLGQKVIPCQN